MEKLSKAHEDYLEAIVMLGGSTEQPVRSIDIANKLGVTKASVNKAITTLKEKGFLDQPYYGDITLTAEGFAYGSSVYKRHRYLQGFLINALGIEPEVAEEEGCMMEHSISDDSFEKWVAFIDANGYLGE